jgi:dolichyl-phosphate beta-glucosyltransferase
MYPEFSLVIPAFNEEDRLPPFLLSVQKYCDRTWGIEYEVIVVDDGSEDSFSDFLEKWKMRWPQLKVLSHHQNRGKGAAVRTGMLAARGKWVLFADADGATPISEEFQLRQALMEGFQVAIGSRLLADGRTVRNRRWFRHLTGISFSFVCRYLMGLNVADMQCGFKMFTREAGQTLFQLCEETRFLFDLEILFFAQRLGYRIAEIPVTWREVAGSKVDLLRDGFFMCTRLLGLRRSLNSRSNRLGYKAR